MISVKMSSLCSDEIEKIVKGITEATDHIIAYRKMPVRTEFILENLIYDIGEVCDFWTGQTYIGVPKNKKIKKTFQSFFTELMKLLLNMKKSEEDFEIKVAYTMLFRGTVYRYLGRHEFTKKKVVPKFDNIYVSWSQCAENDYILSKFYSPITFMACEIQSPYYGINLDAIGCSRGEEHEIVFPTIKKLVKEIKYIDEHSEDDEDDHP